ncbi:MAG TPA: hypothetical protein PK690_10945, partial [Emcibacteraceae bacterium]|nr:hypothetical protein [Emcibacteraceae bacterium]
MTTALITHKDCLNHVSPPGHPECVERLSVILAALEDPEFKKLDRVNAEPASLEQLKLVHTDDQIETILNKIPQAGHAMLDEDTYLSSGSEQAAMLAVGAVCQAIDRIMEGKNKNAFCAIRPPGHHAEPD